MQVTIRWTPARSDLDSSFDICPLLTNLPGLSEKEHILRLARGAYRLEIAFPAFLQALETYVSDETALDRQPLLGWWMLGGV